MKSAISEMKNVLEGIESRLNKAEDWISKLEDKIEKTPSQGNKTKKNKDGLRELWDNMESNTICITEVPESQERDQGIENLFEKN